MIEEMIYEYRLSLFFEKNRLVKSIFMNTRLWRDLNFLLTLIINFFILASYSDYHDNRLKDPGMFYNYESANIETTENIFWELGMIKCIFSVLIVCYYLIKGAPVKFERNRKKYALNRSKNKCSNFMKQAYVYIAAGMATLDSTILYYIFYLIVALLGINVHPFFFSFHLLDIIYLFP